MKLAVTIPRCTDILVMLETGLTGLAATLMCASAMAVLHSGLLMIE